jgi:uncharacterized membrane protein
VKNGMNFETSKNLGGIGALLMFLGVIVLFTNQTLVFGIIEIIGGLLIIGSLYSLAKFYKNKGIFTNALLGGVAATIGAILSGIVTAITLLPLETDLTYQIYPDWNGDPATLQNLTPTLGNIDPAMITTLLIGVLLLFAVFCVFTIIAAFFVRRSLKNLATHSNTPRFATVGLMLLIGAVLSIILVGVLLIWISALILAITFFAIKKPQPQTEVTPPTPI